MIFDIDKITNSEREDIINEALENQLKEITKDDERMSEIVTFKYGQLKENLTDEEFIAKRENESDRNKEANELVLAVGDVKPGESLEDYIQRAIEHKDSTNRVEIAVVTHKYQATMRQRALWTSKIENEIAKYGEEHVQKMYGGSKMFVEAMMLSAHQFEHFKSLKEEKEEELSIHSPTEEEICNKIAADFKRGEDISEKDINKLMVSFTEHYENDKYQHHISMPEYTPREGDPPERPDALICGLVERERTRSYQEGGPRHGTWTEARASEVFSGRKDEDGKWKPLPKQRLYPLCGRDCHRYTPIEFERDENGILIELPDELGNIGPIIKEGEPTIVVSMRPGYSRRDENGKFNGKRNKYTPKNKGGFDTKRVRRTAGWTETKEKFKTAFYNTTRPDDKREIEEPTTIIITPESFAGGIESVAEAGLDAILKKPVENIDDNIFDALKKAASERGEDSGEPLKPVTGLPEPFRPLTKEDIKGLKEFKAEDFNVNEVVSYSGSPGAIKKLLEDKGFWEKNNE